MSNSIFDMMNRKLNVLSFAMGVAVIMCVIGIVMIFSGIKDTGSIDFSSPFATGKATSGFVGVTLIFSSMIITIGALRYRALENTKRQVNSEQTIRIKHGEIEIEWRGNLTHWNDSHHVKQLLNEIMTQVKGDTATLNSSPEKEK